MKTLGKLISRIIFGPSLEDYEARQKAETKAAVNALHADENRRGEQSRIIAERQRQLLQAQNKGIVTWMASGSSNITATMSDGIEYIPPYRQEVFQNIRIKA